MIRPIAPIPGKVAKQVKTPEPAKPVASQVHSAPTEVGPLFLANFVHQVVNPINGVIGTLDNITDGTYSGPIVSQKINASRAQLEQCVTLIRNLAYLSDLFFEISGKDALREVREGGVSILPQVVIEAAQFFQILAEKKGIEMQLLDSATQYRISLRPELLKQVFINIFDNWLKYGSRDQVVEVLTSINKAGDLVVETVGASVGFDNNDAENLFVLGFRSREAKGKLAQGSGIGLYICREIVDKILGGHISAIHQQHPNKTTFRIAIPKSKWQL
jgi:signal transduction histidine kinase